MLSKVENLRDQAQVDLSPFLLTLTWVSVWGFGVSYSVLWAWGGGDRLDLSLTSNLSPPVILGRGDLLGP